MAPPTLPAGRYGFALTARGTACVRFAMEYLLGETLQRVWRHVLRDPELARSPRRYTLALRIIAEACEGLHAAHELRGDDGALLEVVHRDVSPANIFVTYEGAVKIVDFGRSRARLTLPPGRHVIELRPFGTQPPQRATVNATSGETARLSVPVQP